MVKKYFTKAPPFINRIAETEYINQYLYSTPTSILFLYGPKSTGKTTLINKVINELPAGKYDINYLNMRDVLIRDFTDFKNLFFPEDLKGKLKSVPKAFSIGAKAGIFGEFGFSWETKDTNTLEKNIFSLLKQKIVDLNEKGIKPVIIIDEFQYLKNVIIDKENNLLLIEELFKFFISLTKQFNLAHVICLTSDSYYIEELYNHTKLKNTSKYFLINHLEKKDVVEWLKSEDFSDETIEYFWENLGGSVWEIWQCLLDYKNTGDYKTGIIKLIKDEYAKSLEFWKNDLDEKEKEIFNRISKEIAVKGEYIIPREEIITKLMKKLVDIDIWFYDAVEQRITANSQTIRKAFEKL